LKIRERTLVFIAASTGIRQSELFALKWGDIDLSAGTMNVARSIVHGFISLCKTESSQKPVPIHPLVADAQLKWRKRSKYRQSEDWIFASRHSHGEKPYWGKQSCRSICDQRLRNWESKNDLAGTPSAIPTRRS
jgi:integrase